MKVLYIHKSKKDSRSASTNRIELMVRALKHNGVDASFFSIYRIARNPIVLVSLFLNVVNSHVIIMYGEFRYSFYIFLKVLSSTFRIKLVWEINEYPFNIRSGKKSKYYNGERYKVDGFITCSDKLMEYYSKKILTQARIKVPLIVDTAIRYENQNIKRGKFITYCGSIVNEKDGVLDLIDSFSGSRCSKTHTLRILGSGEQDDVIRLKNKINEKKNISVKYEGFVDRSNIASYMGESELLVLLRPETKQNEGGVPSKVAEYMSTGVPCLITDIFNYKKVFGANINYSSTCINDFSRSMDNIFLFYEDACKRALQARIDSNKFNYESVGRELRVFLERIS